jgi:GntR family transcriptional regulator, transcriptional repressor for pyruvate dehydrogenase complex
LTEARRLVEIGVAGLAAQRRTRNDLADLRKALDRMRRCSDRDDVDGFTEADLEFHAIIMAAADNPFITALFEPLSDLLFEVRRASSGDRHGRMKAIEAHARILEALRSGSPEAAREAMGVHMNETAQRIDEVIRQEDMRLSLPSPGRPGRRQ